MSSTPSSFHLPLYARILLWFLVNVLVLAAACFLVLRWHFKEGLHGALGSIAEDRLQAIGQKMHQALSGKPVEQWSNVLHNLASTHQAEVGLILPPERVIAGELPTIPDKVHRVLVAMHPEQRRRPGDRAPPPDAPPPLPPRDALEELLFGDPLPDEPPAAEHRAAEMPVRLGTFLVHTDNPSRYWAGVRLPPPVGWQRHDGPLMMLIVTKSATGGGLFLDIRPWLIGIFGAIGLSALLWLPVVRGITHSVRDSMRATEEIAKGRFEVRVPESRSDELGRLAQAVNRMAIQLDGLVRGQKRFLGDVAHELCSPIARMEMSLGILEQRLNGAESQRLSDVREELRQISVLVNELLAFSKAALGAQSKQKLEAVPLQSLVEETGLTEGVPPERWKVQIPAELQVLARRDLLQRAVGNVVRNAMLHAPDSKAIDVMARRSNGHVTLAISDDGPGVPDESLPRLFEPFYRVDTSRTRDTGGTGLGLAIVKTSVESCGGTVTARNRSPHGLEVVIELTAV